MKLPIFYLTSVTVGLLGLLHGARAEESVYDAARLARKLVDLSPSSVGTMATIHPAGHPTLANEPFALQEYYASKNILASQGRVASITVASEHPAASRARVSLMGNVTVFDDVDATPDRELIEACYVQNHPDARHWLPSGNSHAAFWARFDPHSIYYVGGFGGIHFIGDIPLALYQSSAASRNRVPGRLAVQTSEDVGQ
ncbi:hypothetical protein EIP91_011729 [Steccherinum ochraceum]|uniref:CREG-like beta-barrel domain-containing protein n=1 Tax=Steccherinum ochraceum TaxID=92696 RepID=A0A4R0RR34_9APHY|nr:hypothetical protein EIP91_011729 [Steccherinum ochraceum]